ncbi:MAG: glutaminyl-peptide cyclotransferase, partial [Sphingopyxis sp.]|nr:glutaminyl-peptide cyclotransferase [Sphingopyxis sp.]
TGLKADAGATGGDSVLNGIAWDAKKKRLFVTGKYWPKLYEIALADCR